MRVMLIAMLAFVIASRVVSAAPNKAKIQDSIDKAKQFLLQQKLAGPMGSLGVLAYVKSGGDKNSEVVQAIVKEIVQKCLSKSYTPGQHYNYEAGVDHSNGARSD